MKPGLKRAVIAAAVIAGLGLSGIVCSRVGARGRYVTDLSTHGGGPGGTRALFLLAEQRGMHPMRWSEDLGRLPDGGGMLVALGSCRQLMRRELTRVERDNLARWIREDGGVLVVAGAPDYLDAERMGVSLRPDAERCRPDEGLIGMLARADQRASLHKESDGPDRTEVEDLGQALAEDPGATFEELTRRDGLPPLEAAYGVAAPLDASVMVGLRLPAAIEVEESASRHTLLRLGDAEDGPPAAVRVDLGRGAIVALASASAFQNREIASQGGGVLFARLVGELAPQGPLMFDEYHLGVGERRSMMRYLRQVGLLPLILQILLVLAFILWRRGAQFGEPLLDARPTPGGTASYVAGLGALYHQAKDPAGATAILVRRALARVARHHHYLGREPEALAELLVGRGQSAAAEAVRELASAREASPKPRALVAFSARLDALVAAATTG